MLKILQRENVTQNCMKEAKYSRMFLLRDCTWLTSCIINTVCITEKYHNLLLKI